ncbi:MAG: FtsW/RodA/SpoVE family cell cycle protein [Parcubacteria group bacterium]|nr:FtsW/RodA/SpoVE family cell cycle protein [Parcubacteria group bacterium]
MSWSVFLRKFDWVLLGIVLAILALGIGAFYQSGAQADQIVARQITFVVLGTVLALAISLFDYRIFKNYSLPSILVYLLAAVFLVLALDSSAVRGSRSWVFLAGYGFQPSEFAKLALLILLAKYFSQKHVEIYRAHHILTSGVYAAIPAALTLLQPDFGSMMVFAALWLAMLLFSGIKRRHLLTILMLGLIIFSFAWFLAFKPYQKSRVVSFVNPYLDPRGIGYSAIQAQTAFGSGRFMGTVFDKDNGNLAVLVPEHYTDFAFAAFGQKFGFGGVSLLVLLFAVLVSRISSIALRANNNFAKLFCLGLITLIFVHVFLNAGMNLGVLPIAGIPFSFLSYGGSHLITLMIGLGLVESIRLRG